MSALFNPWPPLRTDEEAEKFVDNADSSEYDFSGFKKTNFEFEQKREKINLELSEKLLEAVKNRSNEKNMPYTKFIKQVLEQAIS